MSGKNITSTIKQSPQFLFFSFAATGAGISGSDRIFIELARRWGMHNPIDLYVFQDGYAMCKRNGLEASKVHFRVFSLGIFRNAGFIIGYVAKIIYALFIALKIRLHQQLRVICYSSSEFWMDSLPAFLLKIRYPSLIWVATWYQTAPNPLRGFSEGNRETTYRFRALLYYLAQFPIKYLIRFKADYVIVNNTDEQKRFPKHFKNKKTIVLLGAVNTEKIAVYKKNLSALPKKYAAVFQGRFHPQKGVVELVAIWRDVVKHYPDAILVMIGDGPLMQQVKEKRDAYGLQKNIILTGYLFDGEEKYTYFAQSNLVVHPSFYDSGGMAAAEAMAFGLPCVGFDLPAYVSYYPQGMHKVVIGDIAAFADAIVALLQHPDSAVKLGKEAERMIFSHYSWDNRAAEVYNAFTNHL